MKEIYLVGMQSFYISEAIDICELSGYKKIILLDNLNNFPKHKIFGYDVIKLKDFAYTPKTIDYVCPIRTPFYRKSIINGLPENKFRPVSLIHPSAVIARSCEISGKGVIIGANAVIGAQSKIGNFTLINRGALIGHDVTVSDFATIESGAILAGQTVIGSGSYIAMGVKILPKINIGQDSIAAAGAVVRENVSDNTMVAGVPAVVKKKYTEGYRGTG